MFKNKTMKPYEVGKLMDAFEQVVLGRKATREAEEYMKLERYYTAGKDNDMFIGFLHGYQHAKCLARMDALNLEE